MLYISALFAIGYIHVRKLLILYIYIYCYSLVQGLVTVAQENTTHQTADVLVGGAAAANFELDNLPKSDHSKNPTTELREVFILLVIQNLYSIPIMKLRVN